MLEKRKCEEYKREYKFYVDYAGIIAVYYKVVNGKVKLIKKQLVKDMTEDIDYCIRF